MTAIERVRRACFALPGVEEKLSHGEPTFFVKKRVFAMFSNNHHNDGHVSVMIPARPGVQESLIEEAPAAYYRPPYVGGKGWVGIELSQVDDNVLALHLEGAWTWISSKRR